MSVTVGSLFSGIGGFDLGLERAGFTVKWQVENNEYCRQVLNKHWPEVPCHYDIKQIDWRDIPRVDLICGGFPCQPFSLAGKRAGQADDRYLWPEVVRCLDVLRPAWFFGENVPGIINLALDQVCTDLENLGYTVWPVCIPACAVDAPHQRQRVWIVAHSTKPRLERPGHVKSTHSDAQAGLPGCGGQVGTLADAASEQTRGVLQQPVSANAGATSDGARQACEWLPEPELGRVAHGVPRRVDRLRGLGNAVVPHVVEAISRMILEAEEVRG